MAVKNATLSLDDFCAAGIVIEVTHRQARRALSAVAPSTRQDTDVASDPLATRLPDSPADPQ